MNHQRNLGISLTEDIMVLSASLTDGFAASAQSVQQLHGKLDASEASLANIQTSINVASTTITEELVKMTLDVHSSSTMASAKTDTRLEALEREITAHHREIREGLASIVVLSLNISLDDTVSNI